MNLKAMVLSGFVATVAVGSVFAHECQTRAANQSVEDIKEEKSKLSALIDKHYENLAEHNYNLALGVFGAGQDPEGPKGVLEKYRYYLDSSRMDSRRGPRRYAQNDYCKEFVQRTPWRSLVGSRMNISDDEYNRGKSKLEEFGMRYLPASYAKFEKVRDQAMEVQQMFNEEFPDPFGLGTADPRWNTYQKLLKGLMKVRTQFMRRHDELCHYYLMHKVGAISAGDLAAIDNEGISIWLYEENLGYILFTEAGVVAETLSSADEKTLAFMEKQAPETYAIYKKCVSERQEAQRQLDELLSDVRIMDITRFELPVVACREKIDFITRTLNGLNANIQAWYVEYKTMEKDAVAIAKLDHITALKWKDFVELLPTYLKDRVNGPMIAANSAMNKYYPCNIVREWHWHALGFQPPKCHYKYYNSSRSVLGRGMVYDQVDIFDAMMTSQGAESYVWIGERLDQPTFISGMSESLFADMSESKSKVILNNGRVANCWGLLDHSRRTSNRQKFSGDVVKNAWMDLDVEALTALVDNNKKLWKFFGVGDSDQSVFLARLNEIDAGKARYYGLARTVLRKAGKQSGRREGCLLTVKVE